MLAQTRVYAGGGAANRRRAGHGRPAASEEPTPGGQGFAPGDALSQTYPVGSRVKPEPVSGELLQGARFVLPVTLILDRQGRVAAVFRKAVTAEELEPVIRQIAAEGQP